MKEDGLRERQKRARREALVDAAQELVRRDGLDAVTVEEICAEAGVSTRTFFNYFQAKDDAVLGLDPWEVDPDAAEAFAAGGPTGDLREDLRVLVSAIVDRPGLGKDRIACAMEIARREPRLQHRQLLALERHHRFVADLAGRRLGVPATSPRAELLTGLVMCLSRGAFVRWEHEGKDGPIPDVVPAVMADLDALLG